MRKRIHFQLLLSLALALLVSVPSWAAVEIIHLGSSSNGLPWTGYIEEAARKFEAQNPGIKVIVEQLPSSQYLDAITVRAASGV